MDDFKDIAASISAPAVWYAAVQEASAKLHRQHPGGIDVTLIGHEAWRQLTPVQRAHALDELFVTYIARIREEERISRLDVAAATVKTYLEGDDEYILQDALSIVSRPIAEDAEVTVSASALANVLAELDLIRHRLTMRGEADG
ncbi:hypothetical protein ACFWN1_26530 [Streptomyces sp. NPDC058459]|uniref:hypothetical protein n=1 Tax=Streptomyces sp. NPDC058459 TaxID=3346508 RepID=UPI0036509F35